VDKPTAFTCNEELCCLVEWVGSGRAMAIVLQQLSNEQFWIFIFFQVSFAE